VAWEPLAAAGISLPPRLGGRAPFAMFGRGAEAETGLQSNVWCRTKSPEISRPAAEVHGELICDDALHAGRLRGNRGDQGRRNLLTGIATAFT
jgi:hypothetical protein